MWKVSGERSGLSSADLRYRPVADIGQLCDYPRMRSSHLSLLCLIALASCTSKPLEISANRCWTVSVGDKVEGTAVLFAHGAKDGCIECGASVSGRGCPGVGLAMGNDTVNQAYDRMVHSAPADGLGFVSQQVFLSGDVIPNVATGNPMIRATQLRLVEPKSVNP